MTTITPTSPAVPSTIANLNPVPEPLGGGEFIALVQNGVTYRVTATQFAAIVAADNIVSGNGISVSTASNVSTISLAPLPSGEILVGNGTNIATPVTVSGDATLSNSGGLSLDTVNSNVGSYTNASITVNAKGLVTAAGNGTPSGGFINKFRNGNFFINQRGTSGTVTSSPSYGPDGWILTSTGANTTWTFEGNQGNYQNGGILITGASSNTGVTIQQRIEGHIVADMFSEGVTNITIQFKIVNNSGSSITPTLAIFYANSIDNWGSSTQDGSTTNLQTVLANTTATVAYTWTPGSANWTNGIDIILGLGAITSSGNSVQVLCADIRATPGVTSGVNSSPPMPEMRPVPVELAFCQRYLAAFGETTGVFASSLINSSTNAFGIFIPFRVPTRIPPTGISVNTVGNFEILTATGENAAAVSGLTFFDASCNGVFLTGTNSGSISGTYFLAANTALAGNLIITGAEL